MTAPVQNKSSGFLKVVLAVMALAALLAYSTPASATLGATSAGATIHNVVKVDYKLSSSMTAVSIYSTVDVTVLTVPTTATWYPSTGQTVTGGVVVNYTTTILRSNANGPDQYTLTPSIGANTNADPQTAQSISTASPAWLWGGITTQAAATAGGGPTWPGTIGFPGGSIALAGNPLVVGNTIELTTSGGTKRYTVTNIVAGAKNTQAAGLPSNETPDVVTATPVSGLAADQLGAATSTVPVGTQVGQYITVNFNLTTGNPTLPGTNGTDVTGLSAQGAATTAAGATAPAAGTSVTTTVTSLALTITKSSRILASGAALNGTTNIVPASYDTTTKTAKTGQKIEYLITVINPAGNTTTTSVIITDPTPAYTAVVAASQSSGTAANGAATVSGVTVTAPDANAVWGASPRDFGSLAGGNSLFIVYQVTVN
jgi:hypothetical protein